MAPGLSREALDETRRYWQEQTGEALSDEDARQAISNLSAFLDLLAKWEGAQEEPRPTEAADIPTPE